jgi:hypothetical protein
MKPPEQGTMARTAFDPALFNPFMLWAQLAVKTSEMLVSSGHVIGSRVHQMARAGANPSPRDRREMLLMGSEKVKAATASGLAVAAQLQSANWQLATRAWKHWVASATAMGALATSRSFGEALARQHSLLETLGRAGRTQGRISTDMARLAGAALGPIHAASTANARRLSKRKA